MNRKWFNFACFLGVLILCALGVFGCAHVSGRIPQASAAVASHHFSAGAARVDITPLPGIPMGGHSVAGQISRGVWTRLYARAVCLEDTNGQSIVMVSCDLWSIPGGLVDRVAELVAKSIPGTTIGRDQIIIAATHTHHSPGNFSTSSFYNSFASPKGGFDCQLFNFLAKRIAAAITAAVTHKQAAEIAFSSEKMSGFFRNRSFDAFVLDPESRSILQDNSVLPIGMTTPEYPSADAYHAVDPTVSVLKITPVHRDSVLALLVFAAVHNTALGHDCEVYQADVFGAAATRLERRFPGSVAAIFNGPEGDVSTCWDDHQDRRSVLKMGEGLSTRVIGLARNPAPIPEPNIRWQFIRGKFSNVWFTNVFNGVTSKGHTSSYPLAGVATVGGAEDGRTIFSNLGFKEGVRGPLLEDQGAKQPAFDLSFLDLPVKIELTRTIATATEPPKEVPLGLYAIGPLAFGTLPAEFTTVMGRRIAETIRDHLRVRPDKVILIGLANEYLSYITTPEEYDAQDYEGASTLYGPASGPLIQAYYARLADRMGQPSSRSPAFRYYYSVGTTRDFPPDLIGARPYRYDDGLKNILQDLNDGRPLRQLPHFEWEERKLDLGNELISGIPKVSIEVLKANGWELLASPMGGFEDNEGLDFVTVLLDSSAHSFHWCTMWMPESSFLPTDQYRFKVISIPAVHPETNYSKPFTLNLGPKGP